MENNYDVVIVGGGLSGLSTAHFIRTLIPGRKVVVIEKSARSGGAVQTFKQNGFQGEWGPHGFLDNTPESQGLLHDTGLYDEAQAAPLGDFFRYVCHGGKLVRLPQSLKAVLGTPLVSAFGKVRALAELWKTPCAREMTIGEWVEYRFGRELLPLVDAAVTGSFAGDYTKLCIDAVMPGVRRLEMEAGSVLRGLIRKKRSGDGKKLNRLPSMLNFPEGMERLVKVLSSRQEVVCNTLVQGVVQHQDGWLVQTDQGPIVGGHVVLALPVNPCLQLLSSYKPPPIACVPVSKIINVVMGFAGSAKVPYGFGYLAPEREGRFTLGAMFTSHMFPDRAPSGQVLLEALVGGRRHPERLLLSDEELADQVYADLRELMDLPEPPLFVKVLRPEHGIPQLEMDHPRLLSWRQGMEQEFSGLHICGFGWDGIGMNDMIKSAKKTVLAIAAGGLRPEDEAKVKPVYF
jgi:oxygen-dependent protoporphyrinogen oxidase